MAKRSTEEVDDGADWGFGSATVVVRDTAGPLLVGAVEDAEEEEAEMGDEVKGRRDAGDMRSLSAVLGSKVDSSATLPSGATSSDEAVDKDAEADEADSPCPGALSQSLVAAYVTPSPGPGPGRPCSQEQVPPSAPVNTCSRFREVSAPGERGAAPR